MSLEDEVIELRAAYEEFKESSAAIEEDLEQEVDKLEKENQKIAHKLQLAEQAMENATRKAEQARELANRQILTLEKQVQAMELSMKVMTEERRRNEQEKDDVERLHRQLQSQCEDQAESFEELVEREAMLRTGMEDLELKFHRTTLEHMSFMAKLKAAFKILYAQIKRLKQVPAVQMPDATPEEQASMEEDPGTATMSIDPLRASFETEEAVQAELNAKLQEQLASALAQLDQSQRRVKELELELQWQRKLSVLPDDSPRAAGVNSVENVNRNRGSSNGATLKSVSEGYLFKRGDGALATWKRQLYKINSENHSLEFFFLQASKVTTKRIKLGDIPLGGAHIALAQKDDKPYVFSIQPRFSKKTFYLQAPNNVERDAWMFALSLETDAAAKRIAGSIRQDWVELSEDQTSFEAMYCVVSKGELLFYCSEDENKAAKRYELDETVEIQRLPKVASQRPAVCLKFGASVSVEHLYVGFNSVEKRDTWHELVAGVCKSQNMREDSEAGNEGDPDGSEFPFCGMLTLFDPQTRSWDSMWFQLSLDTNFLDYYNDQKSALSGDPPVGRLALIGSVQNVTSTAIVSNYPAGAYIEHEHIFGLTPPFTSLTRLIQCSSEENLFQWMDGLVTLLDSKIARDPYSTKEGYLYKQGVKATSKWRKKYVVLGLPDMKYYKAGRHTRAVILTLTPESQIILRHPVKKFVYTFTLQESPGSREYLWGSKSQAEGEAWVSAIQACITKLRLRQPNTTTFNIPKLRGARTRDASREPTARTGREISPNLRARDTSPSPAIHTRKGSVDFNNPKLVPRRVMRKNTNPDERPSTSISPSHSNNVNNSNTSENDEAEMFRTQSQQAAAYAFSVARARKTSGPPPAPLSPTQQALFNRSTDNSPSPNNNNHNVSQDTSSLSVDALFITPSPISALPCVSSSFPSASSSAPALAVPNTFNFVPRESSNPLSSSLPSLSHSVSSFGSFAAQPISTAKRGMLLVLKPSMFSRNERWAPMIFELQANDRMLTYYEQSSTKSVQCVVNGCTDEPFARFDGMCAHHHRIKGRSGLEDSSSHQPKKKSFTWNLVGAQIDAHVANQYPGHEFTFGLTGTGGPALVVAAQDEKERAEWLVLLRARIYARFMFQSSSYEGLMGQLMPGGEWKEKYYVVRLGCLECYNRTDHKRAWSHSMTKITKVRAEDLALATTGKVGLARSASNVGRSGTLRSSASFLKGSTRSNASHLVDFLAASSAQAEGKVVCENNADRVIHPKGVFVVDLGSEKLVLGAESPAERDLWIAALDACIKEAQADAEDEAEPEEDSRRMAFVRTESKESLHLVDGSLNIRDSGTSARDGVQISVFPNSSTSSPEAGSEELPSHLTWWANRTARPPAFTTVLLPIPLPSASPAIPAQASPALSQNSPVPRPRNAGTPPPPPLARGGST